MNRLFIVPFMLVLVSSPVDSRADIYRLDGEDETVSFTDTPSDKRFKLIIREPRNRKLKPTVNGQLLSIKRFSADAIPSDSSPSPSTKTLPLQGRITSPVGLRSDPFDGRLKHHNGLDIAAASGTPVKPVAPGTVIFSGWKSGYGNTVILDHNDGMVTVYAHHASNAVSEGTRVENDTVIAHSGSTGRSTGPHLHFEAWRNGVNITADFMPDGMETPPYGPLAAAPINRYLQSDGTIVFTNLR